MADNIISQYYTKNDGMQISNDYQFSILQGNEKIINKNSGEKFVKNPSYSNVFDKTNTFTDYLNDARSTSIASIDDANTSGVCYCKNSSGTQIDTFTCHVPVNNSAPTLSWGQTSTIGTVDGTPLTVKMPGNPNTDTKAVVVNSAPTLNWGQTSTIGTVDGTPLTVKMPGNPNTDTKYSAGTGLTLSGTEFSISQDLLDKINNSGSGAIIVSGCAWKDVSRTDIVSVGEVFEVSPSSSFSIQTNLSTNSGLGEGDGSTPSGRLEGLGIKTLYAPAKWKCIKAHTQHVNDAGNSLVSEVGYYQLVEYLI